MFICIYLFVIGACFGSFAGALIYRLPKNIPFATGRSVCPNCQSKLGASELIPILSYFALKGRCKRCGCKISLSYPITEALCGLLCPVCFALLPLPQAVLGFALCVSLITAAGIDVKYGVIPDGVSLFVFIIGCARLILTKNGSAIEDIVGAMFISGILLAVSAASSGGVGGGDIKLMFGVSLFLGLQKAFLCFFIAYATALVFCLPSLITKRLNGKSAVPMAGFFAFAAALTMFFGDEILSLYVSLIYRLG